MSGIYTGQRCVYLAGPYRGRSRFWLFNRWQRFWNIWRARRLAIQVWRMGDVALCPHLNTLWFDRWGPPELWLSGDLELLARCDVLLTIPGWQRSEGAKAEIEFAKAAGIPVVYDALALTRWPRA